MANQHSSNRKPAALVDRQLERYRSMRDFAVTKEPSGSGRETSSSGQLPFVVQKHAASRLHYDFRLGWNGVLKSWAVAKGPSLMTSDKRLAVEVEDHPLEYGGFEGVIPQGQYGGGTVMLWDTGTWEPQPGQEDVDAALKKGSLKFTLHGTKLKGNWALIRMHGKAAGKEKPNWLLIKEHDRFERQAGDVDILEEEPDSVITKRSLAQIDNSRDHVWDSQVVAGVNSAGRTVEKAEPSKAPKTRNTTRPKRNGVASEARNPAKSTARPQILSAESVGLLSTLPKERIPQFIPPQLASKGDEPPAGPDWLHELKLDGYRIEAHKSGADVRLLTRTGLDWTHRMKAIAEHVAKLSAETLILDGEVVVLAKNGTTSFADLQASLHEDAQLPLTYFAFDLLHLDGRNLRNLGLNQRKIILAELLDDPNTQVRLCEHLEGDGASFFRSVCKLRAEGMVSKRATSKYISGRSAQWVKLKCIYDQEFVVGGFTLPSNGIEGVGALLLGYYGDGGKLIYAGRTGTGFTRKTHRLLRRELDAKRTKISPFDTLSSASSRGVIWVKPTLVAQVSFATWTADNLVRQAAFKGLREDKPATEVRREESVPPPRSNSRNSKVAAHSASNRTAARKLTASTRQPVKSAEVIDNDNHPPIRLTHPDRVLDPKSGLTKQKLADYYWQVSNAMLPQVAGRPLSLVRCPEGSAKPCFFQKHVNDSLPPGVESVQISDKKTGKMEPYITLSKPEALAGLAQMGVLEVHPWGSRNETLEHPDRIIFDLDPGESISWDTLSSSADETRRLLKTLGLESFLKSTGGKGLHVVVPILPEYDWAVVKQFAHEFATWLEHRNPSLYITRMSKADRKGRIFIDYLRNDRGATAVAAFSPRARPGIPVSIPLAWRELKSPAQPIFTVAEFPAWRSRLRRDPWKVMDQIKQRLSPEKLHNLKSTDA